MRRRCWQAEFTPRGDEVYSLAAHERALHRWKIETPAKANLVTTDHELWHFAQGRMGLIATGPGGPVEVIQANDRQVLFRLFGHHDTVQSLALMAKGEGLATGSYDGEVLIWDFACGTWKQEILRPPMKRSLLFLVLLLLAARLAGAADAARPNILFLYADDWGRYASAYAAVDGRPSVNDVVKTPNIDRVAKMGVIFRNAFVGSPSCTPSRSALVSGRYFYRTGNGAILEGAHWDESIPTWPLLLRDAGYHIGKSFKVWSPGTPPDAPFGRQAYAFESGGRDYNHFSTAATKLVAGGATVAQAKEQLLAEVHTSFEAFLKAQPAGKPFCYWFGPTLTHRIWQKGSGKALWGIDPEALRGKMPKVLPDVPEVREDFADYLGEAQAWDAGIGVILKQLEEAGELANTVIVISADHGMGGMPHAKCNLYDFGSAIGLIVAGPGIPGGRVVEDFVWQPDLAATLLELGQTALPAGLDSRSLAPVLHSTQSGQVDPSRTWVFLGRERHVANAREGNLPYPQRAFRTADYLYIRNFAPERWPMGGPNEVTETSAPSAGELEKNTFVAFADMDCEPDQGVAGGAPARSGVGAVLPVRVCEAAGGGALRSAQGPGAVGERGVRSGARGGAEGFRGPDAQPDAADG